MTARLILGLETSCDDTCAAVVTGDGEVRSNVISSQGIHDAYGGVVPEIASRHHVELVNAAVDDALRRAAATLDEIDLVAVTQGPGLVGALLVGVATAKAIAAARGLALAPVDHLQGHVAASFLRAGDSGGAWAWRAPPGRTNRARPQHRPTGLVGVSVAVILASTGGSPLALCQ